MGDVKRYNAIYMSFHGDTYCTMERVEHPEGRYVTHADYVAREAELVGRIGRLRDSLNRIATRINKQPADDLAEATLIADSIVGDDDA